MNLTAERRRVGTVSRMMIASSGSSTGQAAGDASSPGLASKTVSSGDLPR